MGDGEFAYRRYGRGSAPESGQEEALKRIPIVRFDDEKEHMFSVRPVSPDHFHAFGFRIKE